MRHLAISLAGVAALTLLLLVLPAASAAGEDACAGGADAGGSHGAAALLAMPVDCAGAVDGPGADSNDWYRLSGTAGQVLSLELRSEAGLNLEMCIDTPAGQWWIEPCRAVSGVSPEAITYTLPSSGDWRVRVRLQDAGLAGAYRLRASFVPADTDCGLAGDAPGTHLDARAITLPRTCEGRTLAHSDDREDWYRFTASAGTNVIATVTALTADPVDLCLFSPTRSGSFDTVVCATSQHGIPATLSHVLPDGGDWRLRVDTAARGERYTLAVRVAPSPNDCGTGGDAPGTHFLAAARTLPINCTGIFYGNSPDAADYYKVSLDAGTALRLTLRVPEKADFDLCLWSPTRASSPFRCSTQAEGIYEIMEETVPETGAWRIEVRRGGNNLGTYTLLASTTTRESDCGLGDDAADGFAGASAVTLPLDCTGEFRAASSDTQDWYRFTGAAGATVRFTAQGLGQESVTVCLFAPSGADSPLACGEGSPLEGGVIEAVLPESGAHRLRVSIVGAVRGGYWLWGGATTAQNDCGTGADASHLHRSAALVTPGAACAGEFPTGSSDAVDFYRFSVASGQRVTLTATSDEVPNVYVCLYSPADPTRPAAPCGPSVSGTVSGAGEWRAKVVAGNGRGAYAFRVQLTTPAGAETGDDLDRAARRVVEMPAAEAGPCEGEAPCAVEAAPEAPAEDAPPHVPDAPTLTEPEGLASTRAPGLPGRVAYAFVPDVPAPAAAPSPATEEWAKHHAKAILDAYAEAFRTAFRGIFRAP